MAGAIIFGTVVVAALIGLLARQRGTPHLEHWSVGGRDFGTILVWVLAAGEIYTTFTFLGLSGWVYGFGAPAYYIPAYTVLAYVISYYLLPPIWRLGKRYSFVSQSDFFTKLYDSRSLGVLVAIIGIVFIIPYLQLQLTGLGLIVNVATDGAVSGSVAMVVSFALVAAFVYVSGIKGNAWVAIMKDILMILAILVIGITIPYLQFGGIGPMLDQVVRTSSEYLVLPGTTEDQGVLWYMSTVLLTAFGFFMWPHLFGPLFTARDENIFRRNAVALPLYQLGILFVFFVGFAALLLIPNLQDPDMALLEVVKRTYPSWFLGFIGAAGAVTAMVPAAVLTLTAATLFAKNVLQQAVKPDMSDTSVAIVSRWSVIAIIAIALFFAIVFPSALVNLLLIGYNGVTQFLPGVLFAILGLRVSPWAVGAGMLTGIGVTAFLMIGGMDPFMGVNVGFIALVLNFLVASVLGVMLKGSRPPSLTGEEA
jgi:solute:Na+ symporter, SSS family